MPIPTRSNRDPHQRTETAVNSKIPSAKPHQRTISTVVPDAAKSVVSAHQRSVSSLPQVKVESTEQTSSLLQRKPSVKRDPSFAAPRPATTYRQSARSSAVQTSVITAPKTGYIIKQPQLKPPFSAYQQHFIPKKLPRPASIASDTPSLNESVINSQDTPAIAHLRDELLQLQVLHVSSRQTLLDFETSSQSKLKFQFDALRIQGDSILEEERHRDQCLNYAALQIWLQQNVTARGDKLQFLANCMRDLDGLTAEGGRHSKAILHFEKWFEDMIMALESRKLSSGVSEALLFVEPIETFWSQEVTILQQTVQMIIQTLRDLTDAEGEGIHFVLTSYTCLADHLLQELEACVSIQKIAIEQEDAWIGQSLQGLLMHNKSAQAGSALPSRRGLWDDGITSQHACS